MYFTISEKKLNKIIQENDTTLIEYYKKMYSEIDVIVDNDDIFIFVPKTSDATHFFDGGSMWCTSSNPKLSKIYEKYENDSILFRIHFKKESEYSKKGFKLTKFFDIKNDGNGKFANFANSHFNDCDFLINYPEQSKLIKKYLPSIDKYYKKKSEEWFKSDRAHSIHNLHLNYSLEKQNYRNRIARRIDRYKNVTEDTIKGLSMLVYCNTTENFNKLFNLLSDEMKAIELFMIVTNYNERLNEYSKSDLKEEIYNFNQKYS